MDRLSVTMHLFALTMDRVAVAMDLSALTIDNSAVAVDSEIAELMFMSFTIGIVIRILYAYR